MLRSLGVCFGQRLVRHFFIATMKRTPLKPGDRIMPRGSIFLRMEEPHIKNGVPFAKGVFICYCGKEYTARVGDVRAGKTLSCGCAHHRNPTAYVEGTMFNDIKFIRSLGVLHGSHWGIFECPFCKNEWSCRFPDIKNGSSKHCGCKKGGIHRESWTKKFPTATLYEVLLYGDNEIFLKIGITSRSIEDRMKSIPYKYEILKTIKGDSEYVYNLEKKFKGMFNKYKYTPCVSFPGDSECFRISDDATESEIAFANEVAEVHKEIIGTANSGGHDPIRRN